MTKRHARLKGFLFLFAVSVATSAAVAAQDDDAKLFSGLKFRDLGPAVTSGRISDFAMHPDRWDRFFAATASGGLWRTENAGTTWKPVFDDQGSFSIGVVAIDPHNPSTVWVGTGENNAQRSVAYGDGVYRSLDGGNSWKRVGLENSEHIGGISFHPSEPGTVYVAAQGPLWNAGGDRGVYRSRDNGENWEQILSFDEHTGANDILVHPQQPDLLLASSYQRRRHVWTLINGGPGSGVHRSSDGGATWTRITSGLPPNEMGRIGLAFAPSQPSLVYAIVETEDEHEGVYRSTDFGASWEKRSDYMSSSPQYYNELVVDPNVPERVYSMDTFMQVSDDGGKSFQRVGSAHKHVDEHALFIDPDNSDHLITGNDGGVYESWDRGANWRFVQNLPITQFYRATPDNAEPFYNVYGGTQDNSSLGAPSRTIFSRGIANDDWVFTLGGDGFKTRVDPENADIVYSQLQYGLLARFDKTSFERVIITPSPGADENDFKWNWNSAFIISPHDPKRLYFAAEKLFRSDDGGNSWRPVSPDLTRQLDRNQLEVMGRIWSVDAVAKNDSTSIYGSIIALSESPLSEGLLYVGTDDGLVQVSADGGENWRRHERFGKVPDMSYVADLEASVHDPDRVYAAFDNHKRGDFKPWLFRSDDRGRSWRSIAGNLPERGTVHTVAEDHEVEDLLFAGTEFGVFFTRDGGDHWTELTGGMPTIAVRDMEIQRRENDLVLGTFGRGIRILDDYSPLRTPASTFTAEPAWVFEVKPAWLYAEADLFGYGPKGFQGESFFVAPNPPFGAVVTYHLRDGLKKLSDQRREAERERLKSGADNPYPDWNRLREEDRESAPAIELTIRDSEGQVVRRFTGPTGKGIHRVAWDLRGPAPDPVELNPPSFRPPWASDPRGTLVAPGEYEVSLASVRNGQVEPLGQSRRFTVRQLDLGLFRPSSMPDHAAEMARANDLARRVGAADGVLSELNDRVSHLEVALRQTPKAGEPLRQRLAGIRRQLYDAGVVLNGDRAVARANEPTPMSLNSRMGRFAFAHLDALAPVTDNQRESLEIARRQLEEVTGQLREARQALDEIDRELGSDAPWTPGRPPVH